MNPNKLYSIILPVHNQASHIEQLIDSYMQALEVFPAKFELILVENNSRDTSAEECRKLTEKYAGKVRLEVLEQGGWGRAVKHGLSVARGDYLCYTNSARTSARELVLFLLYSLSIPDAVIKANRKIRDNALRRLGSLLYNIEVRVLFNLSYWDINGTPKIFPRTFDKLLSLTCNNDLFDAEFNVVCAGNDYPLIEVPIINEQPRVGKSTTNVQSAFNMYIGVIQLWKALKRNG
jgi:glycosyltransferase involved in cell wall biosynthesis